MTIIDLRPYEKQPGSKSLAGIIIDCFREIRGATKIIYETPDQVWVTKTQATQFGKTVTFIDGNIEIPVVVKDELTR